MGGVHPQQRFLRTPLERFAEVFTLRQPRLPGSRGKGGVPAQGGADRVAALLGAAAKIPARWRRPLPHRAKKSKGCRAACEILRSAAFLVRRAGERRVPL